MGRVVRAELTSLGEDVDAEDFDRSLSARSLGEDLQGLSARSSEKVVGVSPVPSGDNCSIIVVGLPEPPKRFSHWLCITSFQLVYSSVNTGMGLFVLPTEAERLNEGNAATWLGVYLALCGIAQLICPIAGKLSDRHRSRWGRRRPYMVGGGIVAIVSFALMGVCSWMIWPVAYAVSLFSGQLAINVVFSAQCGLPADLQGVGPSDEGAEGKENGVVSGAVALHSFCGALVAMGVVIGTRSWPVQIEYPVYMLKLAIVTIIVCMSAKESPTHMQSPKGALSLADLGRSYSIDMKRDMDFLWVCVGRLFFYVSTSSVVFIKYYIRDMLHVSDESTLRFRLAVLVISAQLVGAVFSIPFSRLSNSWGRKRVIYLACIIMTCTFTLYIAAPKVGDGSWPLVLVAGLCYGVGSGAYLSVDYALALDCLPSGKTTAEAFGLWGVAGFVGATAGPLVGGGLLSIHQISERNGGEYGFWGYAIIMFFLGCVMNALVSVFTRKIQKAK